MIGRLPSSCTLPSSVCRAVGVFVFFFNDTATTEIYTLSLHDALPISAQRFANCMCSRPVVGHGAPSRSEEHTSELQSLRHLVCRLLLEKKNQHTRDGHASFSSNPYFYRWPPHPTH